MEKLALLGIPYALALGLTAGIICFIPVIGPVLSFMPALLVAFTEGGGAAMKVTALYIGIQLVETNLITPVIQKKLADIPPVLLILTQAVAGVVFGLIGVALAAPGLVVALVLVDELYLPDEEEPAHGVEVATVSQEPGQSSLAG